jgi:hypothetical protein
MSDEMIEKIYLGAIAIIFVTWAGFGLWMFIRTTPSFAPL